MLEIVPKPEVVRRPGVSREESIEVNGQFNLKFQTNSRRPDRYHAELASITR